MHLRPNGKSSFTLLRFIVIIFLLANIGCQKEVSSEGGTPPSGGGGTVGGSAVFTLVPSGANCSDAVVDGALEAGKAAGMDDELIVTVNVTKTGDWTYSTALVNGFAFAGFGTFTTTGNQIISLMAVGTPVSAGTSRFNLNIGGAICYIGVPVATAGSSTSTLGAFYYKATIDGVNYVQDVTLSNGYEPGVGMGGVDDVVFGGGINWGNPPLPAGKTEFGIDKGVMHNYQSATQAQFKAFFPVGIVAYAPASFSNGDGVKVYWTDAAGATWETRNGPADQTGSTFNIVTVSDFTDVVGDYYVKVKAQFNCKLYNTATGAMKQLTSGEAVIAFGMF